MNAARTDATARSLSVIFEMSLGEILNDWKNANATSISEKVKKEDFRNYRYVSSMSGKTLEQLVLEMVPKHWGQVSGWE